MLVQPAVKQRGAPLAEFGYLVGGGGTAGWIVTARVADASIFPKIPSVNPVVAVMLTAERAADLIRQDSPVG